MLSFVETRFEVQYERVPVCSRSSSALHAVLSSPNYPDTYPNDMDCFAHVVPPQPASVDYVLRGLVLQFHSFSLEESASTEGRLTMLHTCSYDWLEVTIADALHHLRARPAGPPPQFFHLICTSMCNEHCVRV